MSGVNKREFTIFELMERDPSSERPYKGPVDLACFSSGATVRSVLRDVDDIHPDDLVEEVEKWQAPEEVPAELAASEPFLWQGPSQPVDAASTHSEDPLRIGDGDDSLVTRLKNLLPAVFSRRGSDNESVEA